VPGVRTNRQKEGRCGIELQEGGLGPYRGRGGSLLSTSVNIIGEAGRSRDSWWVDDLRASL
jgi:hypothetical protein